MKKCIRFILFCLLVFFPCLAGMAEVDHTEMFYVNRVVNSNYDEALGMVYTLSAYSEEAPDGIELTALTAVVTDEVYEDGILSHKPLDSIYYVSSGDIFVPFVSDGFVTEITRLISANNIRYGQPGFYYRDEEGTEIIFGYLSAAEFSEKDIIYNIAAMPGSDDAPLCTVNESEFSTNVFMIDIVDYEAKISVCENLAAACVMPGNAWVEGNVTREDGYAYYLYAKRVNGIVTGAAVYKVDCAAFISDVARVGNIQNMGYCGTDVRWTLSYDGVLQIEGTGAMDADLCQWDRLKDQFLSIDIGDGVTEIASESFSCSAVQNISVGKNVKTIGNRAFWDCRQLKELALPASVSALGEEVFRGTRSLKTLTVASGNTAFTTENNILYNKEKSALYYVSSGFLENTLTIPSTVVELKIGALADAVSVSSFSSLSGSFYSEDGVLYAADRKTLIRYPAAKTNASYTILPSAKNIAPYAFYRLSGLKGLALASSTVNIGDFAFSDSPTLRGISLPSHVTFEKSAFLGCGVFLVDYEGTAAEWKNIQKKDASGILGDCRVRYGEDLALPVFYVGVISHTRANSIGASPYIVLTDNGSTKKLNCKDDNFMNLGRLCLAVCETDGTASELFFPTVKSETFKTQAKGITVSEQADGYVLTSSYMPSKDIGFTFGEQTVFVPKTAKVFLNGEEIANESLTASLQTATDAFGYVTVYASRNDVYSIQIVSPSYTGIIETVSFLDTKYVISSYTEDARSEWVWDTAEKNVIFVYNEKVVGDAFMESNMSFAVVENQSTVWVYLSDETYTGASTSQFDGLAFMFNEEGYVTYYYDCNIATYETANFYVNPFGVIIYQGEMPEEIFMGYLWDIEDGIFTILSKNGTWEYIAFSENMTVYHKNNAVTYTSREAMLAGLFEQTGGFMSYTEENGFSGRDVILYTIGEGEIDSFTIAASGVDHDDYMLRKEVDGIWDSASGKIASTYVSASTVIFGMVGDGNDRTDYVVLPQSKLYDGETYRGTVYFYGNTESEITSCVVLYMDGNTPVYSFESNAVNLIWTGKDDLPTRVFQAEYDADGRMTCVVSNQKIIIQGSNEIPAYALSAQADSAKLFFWDEKQIPVMHAIDIPEN
ncbi:MAG: leucine-rich repeat protein [Clostridia bacterium]|nr:leucine-rich repeat protein [Clostridia bacterium]